MAGPANQAKVYVILGSHACRATTLMLEHKGVPFETVQIPTPLHPLATRLRGFPDRTVPAIRVDGEKVQTNLAIARFLEELEPEPPLFPADPEARRAVEEAEAWADEKFQMTARRIVIAGAMDCREKLVDNGDSGRLGPLLWRKPRARQTGSRIVGRFVFKVDEDAERELLDRLPGMLDRVDAWIEEGVLNGEALNAADFAIAPCVALLLYRRDLVPEVERRPAMALVDRVLPDPRAGEQPARAAA